MLPRFRRILLPVDVTPRKSTAQEIALDLAVEHKAGVSLLHVIQTIDPVDSSPDEETRKFYDRLQERAASNMDQMAQPFREAGVAVDVRISVGDRLRDIVTFAEEHDVDLIIMSSHRIDSANPIASWGTLSYKVSVACECPILLVK